MGSAAKEAQGTPVAAKADPDYGFGAPRILAGTPWAVVPVLRAGDEPMPVPWHLKVLAAGIVVYLAFRLWQGAVWLLH